MSEYFRSPIPFVGSFIFPTAVLGGGGIALLLDGGTKGVTGGVVFLAVLASCYGWAISLLVKPAVRITDRKIEVRGHFGRIQEVDDPREYQLVEDPTWIGFRRRGAQDIMISKGAFSKKTRTELEDYLRRLPFASVI